MEKTTHTYWSMISNMKDMKDFYANCWVDLTPHICDTKDDRKEQTSLPTGWWLTYPSDKYEFVSRDDEIPNIWKHTIHVPNHQTANVSSSSFLSTKQLATFICLTILRHVCLNQETPVTKQQLGRAFATGIHGSIVCDGVWFQVLGICWLVGFRQIHGTEMFWTYPWRIHGAAIWMVTWIPSIYPKC